MTQHIIIAALFLGLVASLIRTGILTDRARREIGRLERDSKIRQAIIDDYTTTIQEWERLGEMMKKDHQALLERYRALQLARARIRREQDQEPSIDDTVQYCPECQQANQFGDLCPTCLRERDYADRLIGCIEGDGDLQAYQRTQPGE